MMKRFKNPILNKLQNDNRFKELLSLSAANGRRDFLKQAAVLAGGTMVSASLFSSCKQSKSTEIAVVGGGLAGLYTLYLLEQQGFKATLFEADNRIGGRVRSFNDPDFSDGVIEMGGTFIDSEHNTMLDLIDKLGLSLIDLHTDDLDTDVFEIDGQQFTYEMLADEVYQHAGAQFLIDMSLLPEYIESGNVHLWRLYDSISLSTYLAALKLKPWFVKLIKTAFEAEFGMSANKQSAMNFMSLFNPEEEGFEVFGDHDKRFVIKGGNELLVQKLAENCKSPIRLNQRLIETKKEGDKLFLTFENEGKKVTHTFNYVVFALPYANLRNVAMGIPLSEVRTQAIQQLGYGQKSTIYLSFHDATWRNYNATGNVLTNNAGFMHAWDATRLQQVSKPVLSFSTIGNVEIDAELALEKLENYYPGCKLAFTGKSIKNQVLPLEYCYSVYSIGQWTAFYGSESVDEGNIFFAGEHVSRVFQGSMNGALDSARIAANALITKIKDEGNSLS